MRAAGFESSIRRRLFFSHLGAVMLVCLAVGGYFYHAAARALVDGLGIEFDLIAAQVQAALEQRDAAAALARVQAQSPRVQSLALADPVELSTVASAGSRATSLHAYLDVADGVSAFDVRARLTGLEDGLLSLRRSLVAGDRASQVLGVELRVGDLGQRLRILDLSAALGLLVALGAAVLVSRIMAGRFLVTIETLNQRCREMAENIDVAPIELETDDELQSLLDAFNALAQRLREATRERQAALESIAEAKALLEQQNAERAEELQRLNALLRDEVEHRLRAEAMIAEAAVMDPLTGLLNRRGMIELLGRAMEQARSRGRPLALAIADVDHFKQVNDRHGHEAGDQVLARVAGLLRGAMHGEDSAARWGGEEFLLMWVDCPLGRARELAERLRAELAASVPSARDPAVTISIGLTDLRPGDTMDSLLARADRALYHAKESGRNLVVSTAEFPARALA